jgi:hypothetical protein
MNEIVGSMSAASLALRLLSKSNGFSLGAALEPIGCQMGTERLERRLAAVLAADVAG